MVHAPELNALIVMGGVTERGLEDDVWLLDLDHTDGGWREIVPTAGSRSR